MAKSVVELNEKNFDKEIAKGNWIVDFYAPWCGPCKMMAPEFESASSAVKGKVRFGKVNIEEEYGLSGRFQILSVPTLILFNDKEQVGRVGVALAKEDIITKLKEVFKF